MMTDFKQQMTKAGLDNISGLGLAYVGDGVYELMVRTLLVKSGKCTAAALHKASMDFVRAPKQAELMERLIPILTEEETAVYKRGRNSKVNSIPKTATPAEYHSATGMEALWGWLYLTGQNERLEELFKIITEGSEYAT